MLAACSHYGRVRTEAECASLAGATPIQTSARNTLRNKLNRAGDRALNSAVHMITKSKMTHDEQPRTYVAKTNPNTKPTEKSAAALTAISQAEYSELSASQPNPYN